MVSSDLVLINAGLFAAACLSWMISTLAAGGASSLMVAVASNLLGGHAIAPVITITSLMASPARVLLFWKHVDWQVVAWYMPGVVAGAVAGGWIFTQSSAHLLQTCMGLFLISTVWQFRFGERAQSFRMRLPWFVPVSFASAMTSAVVGASGLFSNPFYLNYGMAKERMIATRAVNSMVLQILKIGAYAAFGVLTWEVIRYGLFAGVGGVLGIWIGRCGLRRLEAGRFRRLAVLVMLVSGVLLLWQQRSWLSGLLGRT